MDIIASRRMRRSNIPGVRQCWVTHVAAVSALFAGFQSFAFLRCDRVVGQDQNENSEKSGKPLSEFEGFRIGMGCLRFKLLLDGTTQVLFTSETVWLTPLDILRMLDDPRIQKELEILDQQRDEIRRAIKDIEAAIEHLESLDGTHPAIEREALAAPVERGLNVARESLVPTQLDRIRQVFLQYELARTGLLGSLAGGTLKEQLGVSVAQWNRLRDVYLAELREVAPTIQDWKKRVRDELAGCLTDSQREKLKALLISDTLLDLA
jgi:hypothetical protein